MKANVNYNLRGDEEPGVQGRAQNTRFPPFWPWAQILASNCHASKHCYLLGFCYIGTPEAPQEVNIGLFGATMSATPQFGEQKSTQSGTT